MNVESGLDKGRILNYSESGVWIREDQNWKKGGSKLENKGS